MCRWRRGAALPSGRDQGPVIGRGSRGQPVMTKSPLSASSKILAVVFMSGLFTACDLPGSSVPPTAYPEGYVPTAVFLTAGAIDAATMTASAPTATFVATVTPSATATIILPTVGPTLTPTPGPPVPLAAIQVKAPGPMSKLVSPIQIQMLAMTGDSHQLEIDLLGEDGRMLGRTLTSVPGDPDGDSISVKMPFEIRAAGEKGYIQVSTKDSHGRYPLALITVPVLLLSSGESQVNPPGDTIYERVALVDLPPESSAGGGMLRVEGDMLPYSRQPMIMELIKDDGKGLSLRVLGVSGNDWQPFRTTLPFKVDQPTSARLFVHEGDDVLDGQIYIYSQPITLNP